MTSACRPGVRVLLVAWTLLVSGCYQPPKNDLERELRLREEKIAQLNDQLAAQKATIDELTRRVDTIRAIKPEDLQRVFYPVDIQIDKLSGGYNADDQPGDDGVVVYLRPVDEDGDTLKAAGEIRIQLYDLAADASPLIAEYVITPDEARELWFGMLMTSHYRIRCPWPRGRAPRHPEITIRAAFTDYLTQRAMTAQRSVTVQLPP